MKTLKTEGKARRFFSIAAVVLAGSVIAALGTLGAGSCLPSEEYLEDQCEQLADNPATADPWLEQQCVEVANYLPEAQDNFAGVAEIVQVKVEGDKAVISLVLTDAGGKPLAGLSGEALTVEFVDELGASPGTVNAISKLSDDGDTNTAPKTSFSVVVDRSGSIPDQSLTDVTYGLRELFSVLGQPFEAQLIYFSTDVLVIQPFTSEGELLSTAAGDDSVARDLTSLFDGLATGVAEGAQRDARFRFILLVSDGGDNDSSTNEADVIAAAKGAGLPVFCLGVGFADLALLKRIADQTGGYYTYIPSFKKLRAAFDEVAEFVGGTFQVEVSGVPAGAKSMVLQVTTEEGTRTIEGNLYL